MCCIGLVRSELNNKGGQDHSDGNSLVAQTRLLVRYLPRKRRQRETVGQAPTELWSAAGQSGTREKVTIHDHDSPSRAQHDCGLYYVGFAAT